MGNIDRPKEMSQIACFFDKIPENNSSVQIVRGLEMSQNICMKNIEWIYDSKKIGFSLTVCGFALN